MPGMEIQRYNCNNKKKKREKNEFIWEQHGEKA